MADLGHLPEDWERALVVVAHPDDIEYGIAMAVARWTTAGKDVAYLLATRGEAGIDGMDPSEAGPLREVEERESAAVVGVDVVEFLDHHDGVVEYGLPLRREIAAAIRRHRPDVVLTINHELTFGGNMLNMADHRHVGLATLDAARDAGNRWIFTDLLDDGLEPWNGVQWVGISATTSPTHGVDVTGYLDAGVASLEAHRAYIEGFGQEFDARGMLEGFAREAGSRLGCELAVALQVVGSDLERSGVPTPAGNPAASVSDSPWPLLRGTPGLGGGSRRRRRSWRRQATAGPRLFAPSPTATPPPWLHRATRRPRS